VAADGGLEWRRRRRGPTWPFIALRKLDLALGFFAATFTATTAGRVSPINGFGESASAAARAAPHYYWVPCHYGKTVRGSARVSRRTTGMRGELRGLLREEKRLDLRAEPSAREARRAAAPGARACSMGAPDSNSNGAEG
jgi:hypothetical protein